MTPILPDFLRGKLVYLSPMSRADAPVVAAWQAHSDYMRLADSVPVRPLPPEAVGDRIDEHNKKANLFYFGIRLVDNDELIGDLELDDIEWPHGVAELGAGIGDPAHWDKGYGSEAMALLLRFGFWEINLYRIQLTVFDYNKRAIAAYERLGFVREGTFREFLQRDGRRYDMHLYGLLRPEWEAKNTPQKSR